MTYCATAGSIPPRPVLSPSITEAGKDYGVHQEQAESMMSMVAMMNLANHDDDDGYDGYDDGDEEEEDGRTLFRREDRP